MKNKILLWTFVFIMTLFSVFAQYHPTSYQVVGGTELTGNLTCLVDLSTPCVQIQPSSSEPAFDVRFNYSNITSFSSATISYFHEGQSGAGLADFEIYDYQFNAWLDLDQFTLSETLDTVNHPVENYDRFIDNGTVQIRFWLSNSGNPSHTIHVYGQRLEVVEEVVTTSCPTTELQNRNSFLILSILSLLMIFAIVSESNILGFIAGCGLFVYSWNIKDCDTFLGGIFMLSSFVIMLYFLFKED